MGPWRFLALEMKSDKVLEKIACSKSCVLCDSTKLLEGKVENAVPATKMELMPLGLISPFLRVASFGGVSGELLDPLIQKS